MVMGIAGRLGEISRLSLHPLPLEWMPLELESGSLRGFSSDCTGDTLSYRMVRDQLFTLEELQLHHFQMGNVQLPPSCHSEGGKIPVLDKVGLTFPDLPGCRTGQSIY